MEVGKTRYAKDRAAWRAWLKKNHATAPEIWLVYHKKGSGRPRIPYNDAVEEALCFGWIDSIVKPIDENRYAQRFSPRRPKSILSAMNAERVRRLVAAGRMTPAGLAAVREQLGDGANNARPRKLPPDILAALRADASAWKNFRAIPESYKRIRVGWIDASRHRPDVFAQRLRYFVRMTAANKRFGMVQ
jgi:uncharacterized protein YdeI (YjbR/CyaY-like superfamily)